VNRARSNTVPQRSPAFPMRGNDKTGIESTILARIPHFPQPRNRGRTKNRFLHEEFRGQFVAGENLLHTSTYSSLVGNGGKSFHYVGTSHLFTFPMVGNRGESWGMGRYQALTS